MSTHVCLQLLWFAFVAFSSFALAQRFCASFRGAFLVSFLAMASATAIKDATVKGEPGAAGRASASDAQASAGVAQIGVAQAGGVPLGGAQASVGAGQGADADAKPLASLAAAARARHSTGGIQFIKAELLGTIPCNRSGLGLSGFHVHEVATSIKEDCLSRRRYREATVVRVPPHALDEFRASNKRMCESDDLLPPYSPEMRYACLTKNHFVSAVKLFASASAMLHGTRELIKPNPRDKQLQQHLQEGIACEVLREELWDSDEAGLMAIINEDNMDASVELATSETEVLAELRRILDVTKGDKDPNARYQKVLTAARQRFGAVSYSEADFMNMYNFATRVPKALVDNMCQIHFACIPAAMIRVRPIEYGLVAKVDKTCPYIKVALIISFYMGAISGGAGAARRSAGGVASFATGIKKEVVDKINENDTFRTKVESFIKDVIRHYVIDMKQVYIKALMQCRSRLFFRIGRLAQKGPESDVALQQALATIEGKYATELADCRAFVDKPQPLNVMPQTVRTKGGPDDKKAKAPKKKEDPVVAFEEVDETTFALGAVASASSAAAAAGSAGVARASDGSASAGSAGDALATFPSNTQFMWELVSHDFLSIPHLPWDPLVKDLWKRVALQGLLQLYMKFKVVAQNVEVTVLETASPIVYQARAMKAFTVGELVLVPFVSTELIDFSEAAKLKRPKSLHVHLPFVVTCESGSFELDDTAKFFMKSPLASASIPKAVPAPFWAVPQTPDGQEASANMQVQALRVKTPPPTFSLDGESSKGKGKRAKQTPLVVEVPALVNTKAIASNQVLVFSGSLTLGGGIQAT